MNKAELLLWLHRFIVLNFKTNRNFCRSFDINEQNLSEILRGRRPIPKRLLRSLNIKTITTYQLGTNNATQNSKVSRRTKKLLHNQTPVAPREAVTGVAAGINPGPLRSVQHETGK